MTPETINLVVTGLLSGGLFAALATVLTSRSTARRTNVEADGIKEKAPAERDNIVVTGAQAAVLTMQAALESAQTRIAHLEKDRESDRQRIEELEARLEGMQGRLEKAEADLGEARRIGHELRSELRDLRTSRQHRP